MSGDAALLRPLGEPSVLTQPFWDACRRHDLVLQRCDACLRHVFYPRSNCPYCGSTRLTWTPASGDATLLSFTVARRATHRLLSDRVPYVIAIVSLNEGPSMTSNVVGAQPEMLYIDQALRVDFEDFEELSLPVFRVVDYER